MGQIAETWIYRVDNSANTSISWSVRPWFGHHVGSRCVRTVGLSMGRSVHQSVSTSVVLLFPLIFPSRNLAFYFFAFLFLVSFY